MTRVGLVGGLGPESTIDYYRRILEAWERVRPGPAPPIVIDSLDSTTALRLVATDRAAFEEYLAESIARLANAGADFIAMTANTPHLLFDELAARSPVPLLSIVETCAEDARRRELRRLLLLGTRFTMEASFYPDVFARQGLTVVTPAPDERSWIHERYVSELLEGDFRDGTRARFGELVRRYREAEQIDGVILGGTELPLLLTGETIGGLPALDTTALHVAAIVAALRGREGGRQDDTPVARGSSGALVVRPVAPHDRGEWLRMLVALHGGDAAEDHAPSVDAFVADAASDELLPMAVFVAPREEGGLAGFLELSVRPYAEGCTGPTPYVESWYVDADVRRTGVGRALMAAAERWAREAGYREMASDAGLGNLTSHAAHRAAGFTETGRAVTFRKALAP